MQQSFSNKDRTEPQLKHNNGTRPAVPKLKQESGSAERIWVASQSSFPFGDVTSPLLTHMGQPGWKEPLYYAKSRIRQIVWPAGRAVGTKYLLWPLQAKQGKHQLVFQDDARPDNKVDSWSCSTSVNSRADCQSILYLAHEENVVANCILIGTSRFWTSSFSSSHRWPSRKL